MEEHPVQAVPCLDFFQPPAVVFRVRLRLLPHFLGFVLRQAAGCGNGDLLLLVRGLIFGAHVQDAVGIDVKRHLDLRGAARSRWNPVQLEFAERTVVRGELALALHDVDFHARLIVRCRGICLDFAGRNRGIPRNLHGHHTAERLHAQRKRCHVQQEDVFHLACQHCSLNRRAHRYDFIGVHTLVGFFPPEEVADQRLHLRDARGTAHQHDFLDVVGRKFRVFQRLLYRLHRALEQIVHQLFEAGARQLQLHVDRPARSRGDERQVNLRLHHLRKLDLGLFGRFLQPLQCHAVLAQVDVVLFLELIDEPVHDPLVDVIAAQVCVAVRGLDFDHPAAHFQHGNVERAAAQVVHRDRFVALLVQAVGQRCRRRLVDNAHHFHTGDFACLLGGLALGVVEVRRDGDHGLGDLFPEKIFRRGFQLRQDHGGNLRRAVRLAGNLHTRILVRSRDYFIGHAPHFFGDFVKAPAHEAFDGIHGVFGIGHRLALRHLADEPLARLGDGHDGRCCPRAFLVGDDHRLTALHHGHHGVRRSEVNSNNLAHCCLPPKTIDLPRNLLKLRQIRLESTPLSPTSTRVYKLSVHLSSFLI